MELIITTQEQAKVGMRKAYDAVLAAVAVGARKVVKVCEPKRTDAQNRLLHAMLGEISKRVEWAGSKHSIEVWKRLMVASWLRAIGESPLVLPALDRKGIDIIFERTSEMGVGQLNSLIAYVDAWMAEFCPVTQIVDPCTGEIIMHKEVASYA